MTDTPAPPVYRIVASGVDVQAPTKDECLELFRAVTQVAKRYPIAEAIR